MYKFLVAVLLFLLPGTFVFADYTISTVTNSSSLTAVGYTDGAGDDRVSDAQQVITTGAGTVSSIVMSVATAGSPGDNLVMKIYADSGDLPSGAAIATSNNVSAGVMGSGCPGGNSATRDETFTFSSPVSLSAATKYWFAIERTGALDGTDFYRACGDDAGAITPNSFAKYTSSWANSPQTIRLTADVVEGGSSGTSTATSTDVTVDNPNQNLFNGVILFMLSFWGVIWFFRKNK